MVGMVLAFGMVAASLFAPDVATTRQRVERRLADWERSHSPTAGIAPRLVSSIDEDAGLGYGFASAALRFPPGAPGLAELVRPEARALRAAAWPALAPIVEGVRWAAHARPGTGDFLRDLVLLLDVASQSAWDRGDHDECVQAWLDMVEVGRDLRRHWDGWPFGPIWPEERLARLAPAAMRRLAEGLATIEPAWPVAVDVADVVMAEARVLVMSPEHVRPFEWRETLSSWRHGFDPLQRELVVADELLARLPLLEVPAVTWPERQAQLRILDSVYDEQGWSRVSNWLRYCLEHEESHWHGVSQLRLLRLALAFRLGEPLPDLVDPLTGGRFDIRIEGDVASFRSTANGDSLVRWIERRR